MGDEEKGKGHGGKVMAKFHSYDPEHVARIEKKLVRRLDTRIMPLVVIVYIFCYLDRNSITQARLYGLQKDTKTRGAMYNTAIAMFSAGYVATQLPSTVLMTKLRPSIYLPTTIIVWAIVSGCTAAVHNPAGLLIARFVLGLVEAPFYPGAVYFLSCWYTKRELGIRMALLASGGGLSSAFAGLISAGILQNMEHVDHLQTWRWLFILEACATITLAVVALIFLPDYPRTTKWLSEEERIVAQGRIAADAASSEVLDEERVSIMYGIKIALQDPRTWLFAGMQMCASCATSFSRFFPTLIQGLGFKSNFTTLLLTSPPYVFSFIWSIVVAWLADRKQARSPFAGASMLLAIVGTVMLIALPVEQRWVRYAFCFFVAAGSHGVSATTYTWLSSTIVRPPIKRAAAIGIVNSISSTASLWDSYFWLDIYSPSFRVSWGASLAFMTLGLALIITLRLVLQRGNRRFDELASRVDPEGRYDPAAISALDEEERRAVKDGFRFII
ncbi:MFS general substrate transporter [Lophiostoma macrostomum CBS 122681]|uniref:MFS general substrate transporter n=1 Tax=Lophiostoma macrostomum CBS 122681 TaxID=1314788 RepID=A0A6A6T1T0_9PLEO|nr:MFS general substrate transporter [Lophiostoma macrostomum CBS 122681]